MKNQMINYIYDGSFEGLLTCIYESFYRHENPQNILSKAPQQESLFDDNVNITTDIVKSMKVYNSIKEKISHLSLKQAYYTYLSDVDTAGNWIFEYLKLGWRMGQDVDLHLSDDRVLRIHKISRKVLGESHRMLGLIRFKQLNENLYYAPMEPDYNITGLIAPHFAKRMADQNWIIHDIKREIAAMYNMKEWVITNIRPLDIPESKDKELDYQNLWKLYFKNISIANKINPKLQKQFMPARYWKHLVEK